MKSQAWYDIFEMPQTICNGQFFVSENMVLREKYVDPGIQHNLTVVENICA